MGLCGWISIGGRGHRLGRAILRRLGRRGRSGRTARRKTDLRIQSGRRERAISFEVRSAARLVSEPADGGTIVTAGTGSGKTLAFYLPALVRIGESMGPDFWVKTLAVYPRIELLKDQFGEAYRIARALDGLLEAK